MAELLLTANGAKAGALERVFSELSAFLNERKVVSEGELRLKIRITLLLIYRSDADSFLCGIYRYIYEQG